MNTKRFISCTDELVGIMRGGGLVAVDYTQIRNVRKQPGGKTGMVLRVDSIAESGLKERLMTMGLLPGTKISVLRSAPLGDPMAIGLRSYHLAIRRKDAANIQVSQV